MFRLTESVTCLLWECFPAEFEPISFLSVFFVCVCVEFTRFIYSLRLNTGSYPHNDTNINNDNKL